MSADTELTADFGVRRDAPAGSGTSDPGLWSERGSVLLMTLMMTLILTALGATVVLVTSAETMITTNYRAAVGARYAAEAGIERALQDLVANPRWDDMLSGLATSGFTVGGMAPRLADGSVLDLAAETVNLQAETDAAGFRGTDTPTWRLHAWGPVNSLVSGTGLQSPLHIAVWLADDPSETDGNPQADANGVVTLHAQAFGPGGLRSVVRATVVRTPGTGGVRVASWRAPQ